MTEFERQGEPIEDAVEIAASPEACYRAFADPEGIARWFVDRAEGVPEVGETITWHFEDFGFAFPYTVVAAEPGRRFALGFRLPGMPDGLLEVEFEGAGEGRTRVRLVNWGFHRKDTWDEEYEGIVSGWAMSLATLRHQLEHFPGQDRTSLILMRPAQLSDLRDVVPLFRSAEGLASWLTREGEIGAVGAPLRLVLHDGSPLTGTVLAHTAFESLVSWDEEHAALGLKAFRAGPGLDGKRVALHASGWGWDEARRERVRARLEPAFERLAGAVGVGG